MNDKMIFQIPGMMTKFVSLPHNSLRITFETQENIDKNQIHYLLNLINKIGWFSFAVSQIEAVDIEKLPKIEPDFKGKTPSQRLRAKIYILGQQKGEKDAEAFYLKKMQQIEDWITQQLE